MADIVKGQIGNALESVAPDGIVATADAIYDETKGKYQEQINAEVGDGLNAQYHNTGYYECGTAAATAAKTVTASGYQLPATAPYGGSIKVKFTNKNSAANPTLSINQSTPKPLYYNGAIASSTNTWDDNDVLELYYDGTNFNAKSVVEKFATGEKVKNVGIDSEPTANSNNLVKSKGVQKELTLGAVYDVSAKNPTAGPNNDGKWESLSALLSDANLNTLIPTSVRKGGMSIKFVQSSDNKYVQYILTTQAWSIKPIYWLCINNLDEQVNGKLGNLTHVDDNNNVTSVSYNNSDADRYRLEFFAKGNLLDFIASLSVKNGASYEYTVYIKNSSNINIVTAPAWISAGGTYSATKANIKSLYSIDDVYIFQIVAKGSATFEQILSDIEFSVTQSYVGLIEDGLVQRMDGAEDAINEVEEIIENDNYPIVYLKNNETVNESDYNTSEGSRYRLEFKKQNRLTGFNVSVNVNANANFRYNVYVKRANNANLIASGWIEKGSSYTCNNSNIPSGYTVNDIVVFHIVAEGDATYQQILNDIEFSVRQDCKVHLKEITSDIDVLKEDVDVAKNDIENIKASISRNKDDVMRAINHRGYNTVAPENTIPAYQLSIKMGFNWGETDIQFTSDNVPVLLHDNTINRTARNADGSQLSDTISINDITYAESQAYDFGIWKGAEWAGTKLPTLEELLVLCKKTGYNMYLELKDDVTYTTTQIQIILSLLEKYEMKERISIVSFKYVELHNVFLLDDTLRLGLVVQAVDSSAINKILWSKGDNNEVVINSRSYTQAEYDLCKASNIPLEVWNIHTDQAALALPYYVSGVSTDLILVGNVIYNNALG